MNTQATNIQAPDIQDASIQDPLAQLRDIHLPDPILWWPPAPGWWVLAILVVAATYYTLRWWLRRRAYNCYRSEALSKLDDLYSSLPHDRLALCREILTLLRRTAKTAYPDRSLESELTPKLLSQLNEYCPSPLVDPVFNKQMQEQLGSLPYQANPDIPEPLMQQLHEASKQWLKKHRRKPLSC
ncbi:MAG: DUF4381 domain-containing protein [Porticoccus sp.]|nr:DUF4381 domain-containing protein [Porticoccus sp.]